MLIGGSKTQKTSKCLFEMVFGSRDSESSLSTFIVDTNCELPPDLISFTRLLLQPQAEWEKTRSKSKLPKATLDSDISAIAISVLEKRLTEYPTTVEVRLRTI